MASQGCTKGIFLLEKDGFQISIINSVSDWEGLSKQWNELLAKSNSDTIFLSWEWLFSWAECYLNENRKLFILAVYDDGELIGIAPWYINHAHGKLFTLKQIEFLGAPDAGSDYLDVFIKKGKEKEITTTMYNFLLNDAASYWDCLQLNDIPANSQFLLHFLNKIEDSGKYAEISYSSFCPHIALPKTTEDFMSGLSSNRREQFRRHWKVLKKDSNVNHQSYLSEDIEKGLKEFLNLYKEKSDYWNEQFDSFVQKFAFRSKDKGSIQIDFLSANGNNMTGLLHLRYQNTLLMYLMAVDKAFNPKISIGNILVGLCINKAIDDGFSNYDFLKGTENYKFHWTNSGKTSVNIIFYQKKIISILHAMKKFITYTAKIILR